jgi:hypothetical protein
MFVICAVEYWTHMQMVMLSNPGQVKICLFHPAAMLLFYIVQRITATKMVYFSKMCFHA